jgi:myo-inositol 2-dehydrogenase / D-chiro-inositol 1-dehydrogenase
VNVRIGFLGAGNIAGFHAAGLCRPGVGAEITAVHDPDGERAASFCGRWGGRPAGSVEEVVEASDAVYVCTWTSEHPRLVEAVVGAGRAVFCEKPLGRDLDEARRVARTVAEAGVVEQVGLVLRRSPVFNLLRAVVTDPEAGPPMAVVYRDDQYLPVQGRYRSTWRADRDKAGSGVLMEHSIHDLDLLEWMFGPMVAITATAAHHHGVEGIEDAVSLLAEHDGGPTVSFSTVWHDVLSRPSQRFVEVLSQRQVARLEGEWTGSVRWERADEDVQEVSGAAVTEAARRVAPAAGNPDRAFVAAVRERRSVGPGVADALRAHVLVDAAHRSIRSGSRVAVGPEGAPEASA